MSTTACDDQLTVHPEDERSIIESFSGVSISDDQRADFVEAARPLMKWLTANLKNPSRSVVVNSTSAVLVESAYRFQTDEYLAH